MTRDFTLVTRETMAAGVLERHRATFAGLSEGFTLFDGRTAAQIQAELAALPAPIDPDAVDRVMGNDSWTTVHCDICQEKVTRTVNGICEPCVRRMSEVFDGQSAPTQIT